MKFIEKDLEDVIYSQLQTEEGREALLARDFPVKDFFYLERQLQIGRYGTADLVTLSRAIYFPKIRAHEEGVPFIITVYELKLNEVGINTLIQTARYAKGIKVYLTKRGLLHLFRFRIILIGRRVDIQDWVYLFDILELYEFVEVYEYEYQIDGLFFRPVSLHMYQLDNAGI